MTYNHGDYVTVYDCHGRVQNRGNIAGITHSNPPFFDIDPRNELSMSHRVCGVPASRIRKAYSIPIDSEPKRIKDEI